MTGNVGVNVADDDRASPRETVPALRTGRKDPLDLDVGQGGGRLVEDQHARIADQHTRNLNELTLSHAQ